MARSRTVVSLAVGCVLAAVLASGPLVPGVELTRAGADDDELGFGDATVEVVSAPDRARFDRGDYGAGSYYLRVPDATVRLSDVTGRPALVYKVRIPAERYVRGTTHYVSAAHEGEYALSLSPDAWSPEEVDRDSYEAELLVLLRDGMHDRTVYRTNVTVEVER